MELYEKKFPFMRIVWFGQPGYLFLFEFNYEIVVFVSDEQKLCIVIFWAPTKLCGIRIHGEDQRNEQIIAIQIWVQIYNLLAICLWIPQNEKKCQKRFFDNLLTTNRIYSFPS